MVIHTSVLILCLELVGNDDAHLVSHLHIIYDVMACGHVHDMEVLVFFFQKLPNIAIQLFKLIYVH